MINNTLIGVTVRFFSLPSSPFRLMIANTVDTSRCTVGKTEGT